MFYLQMAEFAQLHLESSIHGLCELEKHGLFSRDEILSIVKKRKKFEFRLKRPCCKLEDFVEYITFEKGLVTKIRDRDEKTSVKVSRVLENNICRVYQRALSRYGGVVSLWIQFLDYVMMIRRNQTFSSSILKAIRLHPLEPKLWSLYINFEWKVNRNIVGCRELVKKALRTIPSNVDLWLEFFSLELDFAALLIERHSQLDLSSEMASLDTVLTFVLDNLSQACKKLSSQQIFHLIRAVTSRLRGNLKLTSIVLEAIIRNFIALN